MTFTEWLKQFEGQKNPIGDLASEAAADSDWPKRASRLETFVAYLESVNACRDAVRTLEDAYARWASSLKDGDSRTRGLAD
jgi:hypothetical protein